MKHPPANKLNVNQKVNNMAVNDSKKAIRLSIVMIIYTVSAFFVIGDNEWITPIRLLFVFCFFFVFWVAWSILNEKM